MRLRALIQYECVHAVFLLLCIYNEGSAVVKHALIWLQTVTNALTGCMITWPRKVCGHMATQTLLILDRWMDVNRDKKIYILLLLLLLKLKSVICQVA